MFSTTIAMNEFKAALKRVKPFQSTDETRYYLNGIYFERHEEGLLLTATNGHILINQRLICDKSDGDLQPFILSRKDVDNILKIAAGEFVLLTQHESGILDFAFMDIIYQCKALDGNFPDYRQAIPKIDTEIRHGMNASYLKAALGALDNKPVNIGLNQPGEPYVLTSSENDGILCVVMPMRI